MAMASAGTLKRAVVTIADGSSISTTQQIANAIYNAVGQFKMMLVYKDRDYSETPYYNEVLELAGNNNVLYAVVRMRQSIANVNVPSSYDAKCESGDKYICLYIE